MPVGSVDIEIDGCRICSECFCSSSARYASLINFRDLKRRVAIQRISRLVKYRCLFFTHVFADARLQMASRHYSSVLYLARMNIDASERSLRHRKGAGQLKAVM